MNVKKKLKDLEQVNDFQNELIEELRQRIDALEHTQPVRIVFTEVEQAHPSPERFEREWTRQAEFCGE